MPKVQPLIGIVVGGLGFLISLGFLSSADPDLERLGLTLLLGLAVGVLFQRSRFCMFCLFRDGFQQKNWEPFLGLLVCLGVGSLGYTLIFGAWVPDPAYLPPNAFIGPVSWNLVLGAFLFGIGMALSGSCISSHLYRLGEGYVGSLLSLAASILGFLLGYLSWDFWYLNVIQEAPIIWLPQHLGYAGALVVQFILLGALAWWSYRTNRNPLKKFLSVSAALLYNVKQFLMGRWPVTICGALLGLLGVAFYFRLRPLGVTSELSRLGRELGQGLSLLPSRIPGIDTMRGCVPQDSPLILTENATLILSLVVGSLVSALLSLRFKPQMPPLRQLPLLFFGGILLGYGAFISLGCNIGNLVSGTMALSASGWVFGLFMSLGIFSVLALTRHQPLPTGCKVPLVSLHHVPNLANYHPEPPPRGFISPWELWEFIRKGKQDYVLFETGRNPDAFEAGHIPSAQWFDFREVFVPTKGFSGLYPKSWDRLAPPDEFRERLVVIYDVSGGFRAARLALGLTMAGWHNVRVLDGSLQGWIGLGFPAEKGWNRVFLPLAQPKTVVTPTRLNIVSASDILQRTSTIQVWDTRPNEEYTGKVLKSQFAGTIPGARHLPWTQVYDSTRLFLLQADAIKNLFEELLNGGERAREVVLFCQTGERSALIAWLLYHLIHELSIGLYDHSWEEWGNSPDLPRAQISFANR